MGGSRNSGRAVGGGGLGSVRPPSPLARSRPRLDLARDGVSRLAAAADADLPAVSPPPRPPPPRPPPVSPPPPPARPRPQGLARRASRHGAHVTGNDGRYIQQGYDRHTSDLNPDGARHPRPNLVSVMERNDLDEFVAMAELSERDFTAERRGAVVVSLGDSGASAPGAPGPGGVSGPGVPRASDPSAESLHAHRLKVPRRPPWTRDTPAEVLDQNERRHFLEWRRALAQVEADERVTLTPFEKNLEIWRQLWRVCERSDVVVQVVDARDPLFYRCEDLERFVAELDGGRKRTIVLLNKADLLSPELRAAWSAEFDELGLEYLWWSAKAATEEVEEAQRAAKTARAAEHARRANAGDVEGDSFSEEEEEDGEEGEKRSRCLVSLPGSRAVDGPGEEERGQTRNTSRLLSRSALLAELERRAEEAAGAGARTRRPDGRVVVGMVGYPNVGKSSTVNALVAKKKTGVSATPGKTKHFQTLELGAGLLLADCPGLVFPSFTSSRAELVCNGVLPIDRLTDVRQPIAVVASRIPRRRFEAAYGLTLPLPALHEAQDRNATAGELLRAYSAARGLTVQHGRPDEQRAGRAILKDYINGKLLHCVGPKGYRGEMGVEGDAIFGVAREEGERNRAREARRAFDDEIEPATVGGDSASIESSSGKNEDPLAKQLLAEMMEELGGWTGRPSPRRRAAPSTSSRRNPR